MKKRVSFNDIPQTRTYHDEDYVLTRKEEERIKTHASFVSSFFWSNPFGEIDIQRLTREYQQYLKKKERVTHNLESSLKKKPT